jgi:hypothetical protein
MIVRIKNYPFFLAGIFILKGMKSEPYNPSNPLAMNASIKRYI